MSAGGGRRLATVAALAVLVVAGLTAAALLVLGDPDATTDAGSEGTSDPADEREPLADADESGGEPSTAGDDGAGPVCVAGEHGDGSGGAVAEEIASRFEAAYAGRDSAWLIDVVGDGQVVDPSLDPERTDPYASIVDWMAAAMASGDAIEVHGFGYGEPFELFSARRNEALQGAGIESVLLTVRIWMEASCTTRVEIVDEISQPDPCLSTVRDRPASDDGPCGQPFAPRSGHVAVWTGTELLIHGGAAETTIQTPLTTGLGYEPASGRWRDLAPAPLGLQTWPRLQAAWTGDRMVVVGRSANVRGDAGRPPATYVLSYDPAADRWETSPPLPDENRYAIGAMVSTGSELLLVGGDTNAPSVDAWSYDLDEHRWERLPDPPMQPAEGNVGVWTGTEAMFAGGYGNVATVAFDPTTRLWREVAPLPTKGIENHRMVWTGDRVVVLSGHVGPSHIRAFSLYDLATDSWTQTEAVPIPAVDRAPAAWTGDRVITWGGFGTYGQGLLSAQGALYDPATDTWAVMADSPLAARCDHSGTWTDHGFVVFGGITACDRPGVLASGDAAVYDPQTDSWEPLSR